MSIEIVVIATVESGVTRPFDEIIVPVDPESEDRRALMTARTLALATGAHVSLVAVADPDAELDEDFRSHLHALAGSVTPARVSAVIARAPTVADGITEAAADLRRAVVCMTTEAPGRLRDAFELTSSSAVVHHVHCPVVLVGPDAAALADPPEEIVVFVDTSELAPRVVAAAAAWARVLGVRLWVVEVVEPDFTAGGDAHDSNYVARLATGEQRHGLQVEWEVLRAKDPAKEIARFLRDDRPGALGVLGSHGRSGWAELRLGSTCMKTAHDADRPVVVITGRA